MSVHENAGRQEGLGLHGRAAERWSLARGGPPGRPAPAGSSGTRSRSRAPGKTWPRPTGSSGRPLWDPGALAEVLDPRALTPTPGSCVLSGRPSSFFLGCFSHGRVSTAVPGLEGRRAPAVPRLVRPGLRASRLAGCSPSAPPLSSLSVSIGWRGRLLRPRTGPGLLPSGPQGTGLPAAADPGSRATRRPSEPASVASDSQADASAVAQPPGPVSGVALGRVTCLTFRTITLSSSPFSPSQKK